MAKSDKKEPTVLYVHMDKSGGLYHLHPKPSAFTRCEVLQPGQYVARPSGFDKFKVGSMTYNMDDYLIYNNEGTVILPRAEAN